MCYKCDRQKSLIYIKRVIDKRIRVADIKRVMMPCFILVFLVSFLGKTRTKDKYRVVYTDHQRLELEKEFHYSRYITIRRKAELAANLALSERQVSDLLKFKRTSNKFRRWHE